MLSIVIPTLQKNKQVFYQLLNSLINDSVVGEIIVIDNSLQGIDIKNEKIRVIIPEANLYVNPSWNLGVKEAKFDNIGLLNDDIAIPEDLCKQIDDKISDKIGMIGIDSSCVETKDEFNDTPCKSILNLKEINHRGKTFGIAMFFNKTSYVEIPDEIKIVYGDDWLISRNKMLKRQNYVITNQTIYHLGSLSSGQKVFNPVCKNDAKIYKKLSVKWYMRILSFDECWDCYKLRFLGITFKLMKKNI